MPRAENPRPDGPQTVRTLDIARCHAGETMHFLALSERIQGLLTHWPKDRSMYCYGESCKLCKANAEVFWKGYLAAKVYQPIDRTWRHAVVELTEYAESIMRANYAPGQVWELKRSVKVKKSDRPPVIPKLLEERPIERVPVWDILPVLRTFYHCRELQLGVPNPREAPVIMAVDHDAPPKISGSEPQGEAPPTPEQRAKVKGQLQEFMMRFGTLPIGNGATEHGATAKGKGE